MPLVLNHRLHEGVRVFPVSKRVEGFTARDFVFRGANREKGRVYHFEMYARKNLAYQLSRGSVSFESLTLVRNQRFSLVEGEMDVLLSKDLSFKQVKLLYSGDSSLWRICRGGFEEGNFFPDTPKEYLLDVKKCSQIFEEIEQDFYFYKRLLNVSGI